MRASIYCDALSLEYIYQSTDSIGWANHLVKVADIVASRFYCGDMPSHSRLYADIDWEDISDASCQSILVGPAAKALFDTVPVDIHVDSDKWLMKCSSNFQITALCDVDTKTYIAFID